MEQYAYKVLLDVMQCGCSLPVACATVLVEVVDEVPLAIGSGVAMLVGV